MGMGRKNVFFCKKVHRCIYFFLHCVLALALHALLVDLQRKIKHLWTDYLLYPESNVHVESVALTSEYVVETQNLSNESS